MRFIFQVLLLLVWNFSFAEEVGFPFDELDDNDIVVTAYENIFKDYEEENLSANDSIDPVLLAECEPLTTVAGSVNVISGNFFQIENISAIPLSL